MHCSFLGTGAAGGTPGRGRSRRTESSASLEASTHLLIDVTRDHAEQVREGPLPDVVLLTHGHADASGGFAALRARWEAEGRTPIPVLAHARAIEAVRRRTRRLDHVAFEAVRPGQRRTVAGWGVRPLLVPHATDPVRFPTFAWRCERDGKRIVYASDVARLEPALRRFAAGADLLVLDGATWKRRIGTHLAIDRDLPEACGWDVGAILLTQIGRSAPSHERLEEAVEAICARAKPAYDGLRVAV